MTSRNRTLLSLGMFIPAAIILLTTFACLPAPVGDPEQSKVDDKLTGAWQGIPADPKEAADKKEVTLILLRPWDGKTYFLQYIYTATSDGKEETHVLNYKAWLTPLAGTTFISCEPLDNSDFLPGQSPDKYYWVGKLEPKDDTMTATPVDESSTFLKDLKTRDKIEEAIKAHVNDNTFYSTPLTFKKLDKDHLGVVQDLRNKANLGLDTTSDQGGAKVAPAEPPKGLP